VSSVIPPELLQAFGEGFDRRIAKMLGSEHRSWLGKFFHSFYDMGQNISFVIRNWRKKGHVSWLELPDRENCSSAVASPFSCGFEAIYWAADWLFGLPTEKVAPGHFATVPDKFRRVESGETLQKYDVILGMSYGSPPPDMMQVLWNLVKSFRSIKSFLSEWQKNFRDGIKAEQRDELGIPDPYWQATHTRVITGRVGTYLKIFSQDLTATEKQVRESNIWLDMGGAEPRYIVQRPRFV